MTPEKHYRADLTKPDFQYDPSQEMAVGHLQRLWDDLVATDNVKTKRGFLGRIRRGTPEPPRVQGLYFWGGVGRGKTYLMDVFFDTLPIDRKLRTHFHRFMRSIHQRLKELDGQKNPLTLIGKELSQQYRIICFDEFFVSDITDAMILGGLFEEMFARGVTLLATSNIVPDDLYKDGLQRQRFLPAIAALKANTLVVNVDGGTDYRLRALQQAELYHYPLDPAADVSLHKSFKALAPEGCHILEQQELDIENRIISARFIADDVAWFDFKALCDGPRSQNDYIELAKVFHAVLISNVPQLGAGKDDQARRFINLVDEFYDRNVKLVLSAEVPMQNLYAGGRLDFEFQRTQSRLLEMQSVEYLGRAHKA